MRLSIPLPSNFLDYLTAFTKGHSETIVSRYTFKDTIDLWWFSVAQSYNDIIHESLSWTQAVISQKKF